MFKKIWISKRFEAEEIKKDKNKEVVTQTIYLRKDQVKMNEKLAKKLGMKKNEFMRLVFDTFYNVIKIED